MTAREAVLAKIQEQGKLTKELEEAILAAEKISGRRRTLSSIQGKASDQGKPLPVKPDPSDLPA